MSDSAQLAALALSGWFTGASVVRVVHDGELGDWIDLVVAIALTLVLELAP